MQDTSSNNKRIAKNTIYLYFRTFITMVVSLYTSRVILNTLGVEDYGIYGVVGGIIWTFSFITNSMSGATQRFLSFSIGNNNDNELITIFNLSLEIYIILALLIFILGETLGLWFVENKLSIPSCRHSAALWVYHAAVFTCIISILTIPFNATIISHEKMSVFAFFSIYEVVAKLLIVFMLEWFPFDKLKLYAILVFFVQFSLQIVYQVYCRYNFKETKFHFIWDKNKFQEMTGFAGWSLLGYLAAVANSQGISIVINIFFGPAVNAARAIASQVEGSVCNFVSNFQSAINPQIIKEYASENIERMNDLIFASCKFSFFLLFLICLPLYVNISIVLSSWLQVVPNYTENFLHITLITILINTQSSPFSTAIGATGKMKKITMIISTLYLSVLPLSYFTLKEINRPELAMFIILIVSIMTQIVRLLYVRTSINFSIKKYCSDVLLPIFVVTFFSSSLTYILKSFFDNSIFDFIIVSIVSFIISLLSIYYMGLSCIEKKIIDNYLKKIISYL